MLKKWLYVSAVLACVGLQSLQARNIFLTPGDPANTGVGEFTSDPLSFVTTIAGPAGPKQVIAGPGGKYYVLGSVSTEGVAVLEGTFPSLQTNEATRDRRHPGCVRDHWRRPTTRCHRQWRASDRHGH